MPSGWPPAEESEGESEEGSETSAPTFPVHETLLSHGVCFDLEAGGHIDGNELRNCIPPGDFTWMPTSNGMIMFSWDSSAASVAFISKSYDLISGADIPNQLCQNPYKCEDASSPLGHDRSVIIQTGSNNYFKVGFLYDIISNFCVFNSIVK